MKSLKYWLLVLGILSCFGCSSSIHEDNRGCSFICDSIQYRVEFMSAGCVRILSYPEGDTLVTKRLVVDVEKPTFTVINGRKPNKHSSFVLMNFL